MMANGSASSAVGRKPNVMPRLWNHHVNRIAAIVPKAIVSPWAKLAKRRTP